MGIARSVKQSTAAKTSDPISVIATYASGSRVVVDTDLIGLGVLPGDLVTLSSTEGDGGAGADGLYTVATVGQYELTVLESIATSSFGSATVRYLVVDSELRAVIPASATATGVSSAPTTASDVFSTLADMSVSLETSGGSALVWFDGSFELRNGDAMELALFVDGAEVSGSRRRGAFTATTGLVGLTSGSVGSVSLCAHALVSLAAGEHTITVGWRATSGTARAVSSYRTLTAIEQL